MKNRRNNRDSLQTLMFVLGFLAVGLILLATQAQSAQMANYPLKTTPINADSVIIVDSADLNKTKRATLASLPGTGYTAGTNIDITTGVISVTPALGAAAALDATNGVIDDVVVWVDGGTCSDPIYTTEATCVGTWTPVAALPIDVAGSPITDSGNLITATTIEGALAENRTAIDLNTAKVTNTDDQTATEVPVTATGFTGNLSSTDTNVQTALATLDAMTVSGSSSYVATPPTYSDSACTAGQYAFNTTTGYVCVASGDWNTFALTNWSAPGGDNTPDAFSFTNQTDVAVSTEITSANVQITGITAATAVTATGGTAAVCTGALLTDCGTFGASPGNVTNEQYVAARHTSSASASTAVDTVVTVGTMERTFRSTTAAAVASCGDTVLSGQTTDLTTSNGFYDTETIGQIMAFSSTDTFCGIRLGLGSEVESTQTLTVRVGETTDLSATYLREVSVEVGAADESTSVDFVFSSTLTGYTSLYWAVMTDATTGGTRASVMAGTTTGTHSRWGTSWDLSGSNDNYSFWHEVLGSE